VSLVSLVSKPIQYIVAANVFAVSCLWSVACCAYDKFYEANYDNLDTGFNNPTQIHILSTRMMDNETLFLSAEMENDPLTSSAQRLINNQWLAQNEDNSYSDSKAVRRYLQLNILAFWKAAHTQPSAKVSNNSYLNLLKAKQKSQFQDVNSYDLRVDDDNFSVKFKYRFH
jgi:hypothetical protein